MPPSTDAPFAYHRLASIAARAELVDLDALPGFLRAWAPGGAAMAPLRLDREDRGDDVAACRAVLVDFLAAIDQGRATQGLDLFTDDASFAARGRQLHGRDAIAAFLEQRESEQRHTVHVLANDVVRVRGPEEITLTALLMLYERPVDGAWHLDWILDTTQTFRRRHDGWRISHRATSPASTRGPQPPRA